MFCPHCGAAVQDGLPFCASCGAQVAPAAQSKSAPAAPPPTTILARSGNALSAAERWRDSEKKAMTTVSLMTSIPPFIFIFLLFHLATTYDWKILRILAYTWWIFAALLVLNIFVSGITFKSSKELEAVFERFRLACSCESLIVDSEKVYGTSRLGNFSLSYDQILNVQYTQETILLSKGRFEKFKHSKLTIISKTGSSPVFISFSNAPELYTVISTALQQSK